MLRCITDNREIRFLVYQVGKIYKKLYDIQHWRKVEETPSHTPMVEVYIGIDWWWWCGGGVIKTLEKVLELHTQYLEM